MARILVVHGAGMNRRGKVQTEIFGPMTLPEYDERIRGYASELGVEIEIFHSNIEGEVINKLYEANDRGFDAADYVISGLPFSTLPPGIGDDIAEATANVIRPGGAFLVYQFSPKVLSFLKPYFDRIDRGFEWINVPPATLFWAWREPKAAAAE